MKQTIRLAVCILCLAAIVSCTHKELCYDHPHSTSLKVAFDWSLAAGANPEGMRVVFYPIDGSSPSVENLTGRNGGEVDVPEGVYNIVCFNNDTETIRWRGEQSISTLEAYTRQTSLVENTPGASTPGRATEETMVLTPDRMWRARMDDVDTRTTSVITLRPQLAVRHVTYELSEVNNSKDITLIRCTLSCISGSLFMGTNTFASETCALPFDGAASTADNKKITGQFNCFGCCPSSVNTHIFTIYCWSPGGNVMASFDVTDQIHSAADPYNMPLVIRGVINIPEGIDNGGGFDPGVDDWSEQNSELNM